MAWVPFIGVLSETVQVGLVAGLVNTGMGASYWSSL